MSRDRGSVDLHSSWTPRACYVYPSLRKMQECVIILLKISRLYDIYIMSICAV